MDAAFLCRARFKFNAERDEDLSFKEGDIKSWFLGSFKAHLKI